MAAALLRLACGRFVRLCASDRFEACAVDTLVGEHIDSRCYRNVTAGLEALKVASWTL
jgi:hypothetical protein